MSVRVCRRCHHTIYCPPGRDEHSSWVWLDHGSFISCLDSFPHQPMELDEVKMEMVTAVMEGERLRSPLVE